ncbi:MAG TPA: outer membrane beta-barrel protein [Firmicutes bacterium]|jgi:hypothetical protein|nr:outer membrane beta-barrel protein [Bacillota bacterium]
MKKTLTLVIAVIITVSMASMAGAEGIIKMGYDNLGVMETKYFGETSTNEIEAGYTLGVEFLKPENRLQTGLGIEYQLMRGATGASEDFHFIPAYLTARLNLFKGKTSPYLQGRLGYNLFQVNKTSSHLSYNGGLYYGVGAGLTLAKDMQVQLDYSVHNGERQWQNVVTPYQYEKFSLSVGLIF